MYVLLHTRTYFSRISRRLYAAVVVPPQALCLFHLACHGSPPIHLCPSGEQDLCWEPKGWSKIGSWARTHSTNKKVPDRHRLLKAMDARGTRHFNSDPAYTVNRKTCSWGRNHSFPSPPYGRLHEARQLAMLELPNLSFHITRCCLCIGSCLPDLTVLVGMSCQLLPEYEQPGMLRHLPIEC